MPTKPYSKDLREKVISYIEKGNTQRSAAEIFSINKSTVHRWYSRYRIEGNFLARRRLGAKSKINCEALVRYVSDNPNIKLKELSKEFGVSVWGIYYWLKKLGYSYKKKPFPMWKRMSKSELNIVN